MGQAAPLSQGEEGRQEEVKPYVRPKKPTGTAGQTAKTGAICGARKRGNNGQCKLAAGWGTDHPGIGKCKVHGGNLPNHVKAAAKEEYRILLGTPMEINPLDALIWCIKIRAGEVRWLSDRLKELDQKAWVEETLVGKQFHLYARERQHAMSDLARYSQMAISLGIAERAVKLAETYGDLLADFIKGLLQDLWPHLDEDGRAKAPQFVRARLLVLDGGRAEPPTPGAGGETLQIEAA